MLHILAKIKSNLNLVTFVVFVSNRDIGSLDSLYASGTMLNSCLFAFEAISTVVKYHFQNVGIQYVKYQIHTFCVYVFVLCVLMLLF